VCACARACVYAGYAYVCKCHACTHDAINTDVGQTNIKMLGIKTHLLYEGPLLVHTLKKTQKKNPKRIWLQPSLYLNNKMPLLCEGPVQHNASPEGYCFLHA